AAAAEHYPRLRLPIDLVADRGVDRDVVVGTGQRGLGFGEDGGRLDVFSPGPRALGRVLLVVAADGEHIAARRVERRQEGEVGQAAAERGASGRLERVQQLPNMIQPGFTELDQAQQV